jgi:peroxiredoxin
MGLMLPARNFICMLAAFVLAGTAVAGDEIGQHGRDNAVASVARQTVAEPVSSTSTSKSAKKKAHTLSLMGLDGSMHSLADWKGKVVILNFWATWCSPCLSEIHDFVAWQDQYKTRGLQVVGVGLDEEKKLRNVQRTLEINYPVLIAEPKKSGTLMESWGNQTGIVPFSVVIDRNGRVAYTYHGQIDRDSFDEDILPLLGKVEPKPI